MSFNDETPRSKTRRAQAAWRGSLAGIILASLCVASCVDVRDFVGSWEGGIAADPVIRRGFPGETRIEAELQSVDLIQIHGTVRTSDERFKATPLEPIELTAGDALSGLTFDGDPLRTYLLYAKLAGTEPQQEAWIVLSLFPDEHIELRAIHRNDLFGVFRMNRH